MNLVLRVELTEEERKELDKYILIGDYGFGQISHILRRAVRDFIKIEKEKESAAKKETQNGDQSRKRGGAKETQTHISRRKPR